MSRSVKKHPVHKYAPENGSWGKRQANKTVRRYKGGISNGNGYKRLYETWDIHDYVSRATLSEHLDSWRDYLIFCNLRGYDWKDNFYGTNLCGAINKWYKWYKRK